MQLRLGDTIREMRPGDTALIWPSVVHRFEAVEDTELVEVSTSDLDDVIRLEDDYGRVEAAS
jgi:quercetin dioxygenase-like cupin family protein